MTSSPSSIGSGPAADVVVVGLGAFGSATLWRLAERGLHVVGLDQHEPGHSFGSSHGQSRIIRTAYYEHPGYVPLLREAFGLWRGLEEITGESLLTMTGALMIGRADGPLVSGTLASARTHGLAHELLDAAALRARYPQHVVDDDEVAVYETNAGVLRPEASVVAAVAAARRAGALVLPGAQVLFVGPEGDGVVVRTADAVIRAAQAVITAGPWLPQLLPAFASALRVERQVQMWFRPTEPAGFAPSACPVFMHEAQDGLNCYGLPAIDGATVKVARHHGGAATTPESVDRAVHPADVAPVARFISERLAGLDPAPVRAAVCLYTNTPDDHFVVGRVPGGDRLVVMGGCSGHGFKFAPVLGEIAADLVTTGTTTRPIELFAPERLFSTVGNV